MLNFYVFFLSSIVTILSPFSASNNFYYLFVARLLLGFCGVSLKIRNFLNILLNVYFFRGFSFAPVITSYHYGLHQPRKDYSFQACSAQNSELL